MDFLALNSTDIHDEGSWLHLAHPSTGALLYMGDDAEVVTTETDMPCMVRVRGSRSPIVKSIMDARRQAEERHSLRIMRATPREEAALLRQNAQDVEKYRRDLLLATVVGWENVVVRKEDGPAPCTPENVVAALSHPLFLVQVLNRSADESALFQSAPTG